MQLLTNRLFIVRSETVEKNGLEGEGRFEKWVRWEWSACNYSFGINVSQTVMNLEEKKNNYTTPC